MALGHFLRVKDFKRLYKLYNHTFYFSDNTTAALLKDFPKEFSSIYFLNIYINIAFELNLYICVRQHDI